MDPFCADDGAGGCAGSFPPACDTSGVKYRTVVLAFTHVAGSTDDAGHEDPPHVSYEIHQTITVDRYSGMRSRSVCTEAITNPDLSAPAALADAYATLYAAQASATATSPTVLHYHIDFSEGPPNDDYYHTDITITLSDAYSYADVIADCVTLLSNFPLGDDKQYPWVDAWADCQIIPMLRYDESGGTSPINIIDCSQDINGDLGTTYTGAIFGIPLPTAGYAHYYSFRGGEGIYNPTACVCATEWCTNAESCLFPDGAFQINNGSNYYVAKYAEVQDMFHSHNYFRPCGADRDATHEDDSLCWGDPSIAWPICGRAKILTAFFDGSDTTYTTQPVVPYLRVGDPVDISGGVAINQVVTEVAGNTWTIFGDHSVGAVGQYVKSHGAPDYKWDDDHPKGDFRWQEYLHCACGDDCDCGAAPCVVQTCENDCLGRDPCWPSVMCYSPNTESFHNAKVRWPSIPPYKNGVYWVGIPTAAVDDPIDAACVHDPEAPIPQVEARCDPPTIDGDSPPALPDGVTFGCPDGPKCGEPAPGSCRGDEDDTGDDFIFVP
jgi:hypothetical protein